MSQSYKEQVEAWDILWDEGHLWVRLGDAQELAKAADAAREERDALRAECEALRKDADRLDYIQKHARCDPKMCGNHVWWPTNFRDALKGPTLRDAVDAAIAERAREVK